MIPRVPKDSDQIADISAEEWKFRTHHGTLSEAQHEAAKIFGFFKGVMVAPNSTGFNTATHGGKL
jgi:hypothetical protein